MTQLKIEWGPATRLRVGRGPLDAERKLLEELDELLPVGPPDTDALAQPVLLLVPSKSLRLHLLGKIVEHRGAAILGLECRTHHALALELLERSGIPSTALSSDSPDLFPLFARRLARREAPLRKSLDHLHDGYSAVLGAVRDLLDAGIDPAHVDALEEALATEQSRSSGAEIERAQSLVRVAAGTVDALRSHGLSRSSILFQQATEILAQAGGDRHNVLPVSRVIIYGFNDATGVTTDFLLAAIGACGGSFYLEHPPDPSERTAPDPGLSFSRSYRERIETSIPAAATDLDLDSATAESPEISFFGALGAQAEVREVAHRISDLINGSSRVAPEKIAVVARKIDSFSGAIRTQFQRLGVPFSGLAKIGPFEPSSSRLHAVLQLLRERSRTPIERWLDAADLAPNAIAANDLLVGFRVLGAARLQDAANLRIDAILERGGLRLPLRTGFEERPSDKPASAPTGAPTGASAGASTGHAPEAPRRERRPRAIQRWLDAQLLSRAVEAAKAACDEFGNWPTRAPASQHTERLSRLVGEILRGSGRQAEAPSAWVELKRVMTSLPGDFELDADEVFLLLRLELEKTGRTDLGGHGGGVQVLDVIEGRSRTFDHLFLIGLNRGTFPRAVEEDPLLPDPLRHVLGRSGFGVLPDLPVKKKGFHEERYLFAQLLSSSPRITVSWQEVDEQQNLRAVSPLVERLRLGGTRDEDKSEDSGDVVASARPVFSPTAADFLRPRPAHEAAVLAGIHQARGSQGDDGRGVFAKALEVALADSPATEAGVDTQELTAARLRILDEFDPSPFSKIGTDPGPYLGFVGPIRGTDQGSDPRASRALYVTALQGLAKCPWSHFLQKVLRIEPLPDPLEDVPGIQPLHLGKVIHDVLEEIVQAGLENPPEDWTAARGDDGSIVAWPKSKDLEQMVLRKARAVVTKDNLGLPGLGRALARTALPHLETAREQDWPEGHSRLPIVAAEIEGSFPRPSMEPGVPEPDEAREIRFRADRMDRGPVGETSGDGFLFTDYKTGRWTPRSGESGTANERLLEAVREGEWLQAAAYALASRDGLDQGRYVFLNPLLDDDAGRVFSLSAQEPALLDHFVRAVAALLGVWDTGSLFPRLLEYGGEKEPRSCSWCDVSDACVRGDSGARRRLREWVETQARSGTEATAEGAAVAAAWNLGRPARRGKK